jgi:hypothetical protein
MANVIRVIDAMRAGHEAKPFVASARRISPSWYDGTTMHTGHRLHGDQLSWYNPAPYSRDTWWYAGMTWFVLCAEQNATNPDANLHTATNTRVHIRRFRSQVRRASWSIVANLDGPQSNRYSYNVVDVAQLGGWRTETGGGTSHKIGNDGTVIVHGYGSPWAVADPWNITGMAFDMEVRLILDDPNGADDRAQAKLVIHIGCDLYPFAGATIPTAGYWPAVGLGPFLRVTNNWESIGFSTYFEGSRANMQAADFASISPNFLLASPPIDWTTTGTPGVILPPTTTDPAARRLLFFGDDLIRGDESTANGHRSIRGRVLQQLAAQGTSINALGSQALTPAIGGDPDHEGYAGAALSTGSNNLSARLPAIVASAAGVPPQPGLVVGIPSGPAIPEVIVLWAGRDDYVNTPSGIGDRMAALIQELRTAFPNAQIVVGTLPPQQGQTEAQTNAARTGYATLNTRIRTIAATTYGVSVADVASLTTFVSGDYADQWRLLQTGADKAAAPFATAISAAFSAATKYIIPGRPLVMRVWRRHANHPTTMRVHRSGYTPAAPEIATTSLTSGRVGTLYAVTIAVTGQLEPTVTHTGTLPPGITRSGTTFSGTPTAAGEYPIRVTATNASGTAFVDFSITIFAAPAVTTTTLPAAVVGIPYSAALGATGQPPLLWSVTGTLPAGLTHQAGVISGTPTVAGSASIAAVVSDASGPSVAQALTLTVQAAGTPPPSIPVDGQWSRLPRDVEVWVRVPRDT